MLSPTLRNNFSIIPSALFGDDFDEDDPRPRLAGLLKHAGMALPDPIASAKSNYEASFGECSSFGCP
jgi:hypothetical protein